MKGIPDLWALVKNREFSQISTAMMHAIVVGSSAAIAMDMTVCNTTSLKTKKAKGCYDNST